MKTCSIGIKGLKRQHKTNISSLFLNLNEYKKSHRIKRSEREFKRSAETKQRHLDVIVWRLEADCFRGRGNKMIHPLKLLLYK